MATFYNNTPYTITLEYVSQSGSHLGGTEIGSMTSGPYSPPSATYRVKIYSSGPAYHLTWYSYSSGGYYPLDADNEILPTNSSWPTVSIDTDSDYNCDCDTCYTAPCDTCYSAPCDTCYSAPCDTSSDIEISWYNNSSSPITKTDTLWHDLYAGYVGAAYFKPSSNGTLTVTSDYDVDMYGGIGYSTDLYFGGDSSGPGVIKGYLKSNDDDAGNAQFTFSCDVTANTEYIIIYHAYSCSSKYASGSVIVSFTPEVSYSAWQAPIVMAELSGSSYTSYSTTSDVPKYSAGYVRYYTPSYPGKLVVKTTSGSYSPDYYSHMSGSLLSAGSGTTWQQAVSGTILVSNDDGGGARDTKCEYGPCSANTYYYWYVNAAFESSGSYSIPWQLNYYRGYSITYNANGGSDAPSTQYAYTDNLTTTLSSIKPTKTSCTFLGWSTSKTATSATYSVGQTVTLSSDLKLYAVWKVNPWTLYYQINEVVLNSSGTIVSQIDNVYSNNIPNISTYDYTFYSSSSSYTKKGYSIKAITTSADTNSNSSGISYNASSGSSSSSSPKIIYYIFKPNRYTYTFNLNGGSSTTPLNSIAGYYKENVTIPTTKPTKTNYRFLGWSTDPNATSITYPSGKVITINDASNITLYAVWRPLFYWTGNKDIVLQKNNLINTYINSTNVNTFQNLLKSYIDSTYNISTINQSTKITKDFYNIMAALLEITLLSTNDKITAQHWINLQDAYNNYNPINFTDFEYVKNADNTYELTAWKGTLDGSSSTIIQIPEGGVII